MSSENKIWKSKFLGELDKQSPIFRNGNNEMQFKIKIISSGPSDFPNETVKTVYGFSDSLKRYGYFDQVNDEEEIRIEKIISFLENNYLIFSVKESGHSDPEIDRKYYNSFDLMVISKENFKEEAQTFETIPMVRIEKGNIPLFIDKITNEEYIGKNESISLNRDDSPPFILINEIEEYSVGNTFNTFNKFHVIGPLVELQYKEEYGIKFLIEENLKLIEIEAGELQEFYPTKEDVVFITTEICSEIEDKLDKAPNTIIKPRQFSDTEKVKKIEDIDELKFLEKFDEVCKAKGLVYELKDLYNFHTAMKTQSFVILAGMSGTGKSQLVQCYYKALYDQTIEENLLFIPVRPFWQDDSDLLGYLDTLNSVYRPGDSGLVDFILESNKNPKECYIICLDEMNLARVEHYFSQFLSILERDIQNRVVNLYNSKVENRIFNKNDYPSEIKLGENLLFVGTVNTDESTFSFSDKVLDRANVINLTLKNFIEIKRHLDSYETEKKGKVSNESPEDVINHTFSKFQGMKKDEKKYRLNKLELEFLWDLHCKINKINPNIGIGMRIINQIEQYLVNLPESEVLTRKVAFDLQISQRVFTKLRGSEGQLIKLVGKESDDSLVDSTICNLFDKFSGVSEFDTCREKLKSISRELQEYGHTI